MPFFREKAIVRKFTTEWEVVQGIINVTAGSKTTVTFNPPEGKVYVFDYSATGPMDISGDVTADVFWDGTRSASFILGGFLIDKVFGEGEAPLKVAKNELRIVITNNDSVTHTLDFIFVGFNIPDVQLQDLLDEFTGDKDREVQKEILNKLDTIIKLLERGKS